VACGVDDWEGVTDGVEPDEWREPEWELLEEELDDDGWVAVAPEPVEVPPPDEAEVWVAVPIPNDAPRAPTIPRPASPAWRRLLRWSGVMPRRCPRLLCPTCESGGPSVSVA
jgi:hypothetical protein